MAKNWIITGGSGQLGRAFVEAVAASPDDVLLGAPDHAALDIADPEAVKRFFGELSETPSVVANAAAYTNVDGCESERELAYRVNAEAPELLARASRDAGAKFLHVSTDYVFPGDGTRPYRESDATGPLTVYGASKLEGECRVAEADAGAIVARTSWVFGHGKNFISAILGQVALRRSGEVSGPLAVVADQKGRPTYAVDLASALRDLEAAGASGLFHLSNDGEATWWDLARLCVDEAGAPELVVERIDTDASARPAPRPLYSVLDCSKARAHGVALRDWRDATRAYLHSLASPLAQGAG